jgi:hypothetical protein
LGEDFDRELRGFIRMKLRMLMAVCLQNHYRQNHEEIFSTRLLEMILSKFFGCGFAAPDIPWLS